MKNEGGAESLCWKIYDSILTGHTAFEPAAERLLEYFIYTYFCGAVYDGWIFAKAAFAVYSVRWIFMTFIAECADVVALHDAGRTDTADTGAKPDVDAVAMPDSDVDAWAMPDANSGAMPDTACKGMLSAEAKEKLVRCIYRYSREAEHSEENMDALEEFFQG